MKTCKTCIKKPGLQTSYEKMFEICLTKTSCWCKKDSAGLLVPSVLFKQFLKTSPKKNASRSKRILSCSNAPKTSLCYANQSDRDRKKIFDIFCYANQSARSVTAKSPRGPLERFLSDEHAHHKTTTKQSMQKTIVTKKCWTNFKLQNLFGKKSTREQKHGRIYFVVCCYRITRTGTRR